MDSETSKTRTGVSILCGMERIPHFRSIMGTRTDDGDLLTSYKLRHHLWICQQWLPYLFQHLRIWKWSKRGGWMTVWTKQDRPGGSSNGIKAIWWLKNSQRLHSPSSCIPLVNISRHFINKMSTFSDQHSSISSPDEYPVLTSSELSRLLLDQEMNFAVAATFSSSPLSTTLLRQYLFLSHNLERIRQDLICHQQERESIFDVLSHSAPFQDIITPIILNFWFWQRQVSPVNPPPPILRTPSNSSNSEQMVEQQSVIIQEWSNSDNSLLSYYTTAHEELGMCNNPINVDPLLDPSPSPPRIPVYTPPRTQSAPVTTPCPMCCRHSYTLIQCIWYGPGVCSYCEEVGHTIHNCNLSLRPATF